MTREELHGIIQDLKVSGVRTARIDAKEGGEASCPGEAYHIEVTFAPERRASDDEVIR